MSTYINAKAITNYKITDTQVLTNSSHKNLGILGGLGAEGCIMYLVVCERGASCTSLSVPTQTFPLAKCFREPYL